MELRHLNSFRVLSEELHFKNAAEKLMIAQPALSYQIKQLEEELGVKLFQRSNRKVEITSSGIAFKRSIDHMFSQLDNAVRESILIHEGKSGYLKVGFSGFVAFDLLPKVIERFQEKYENIKIDLKHMTTNDQEMSIMADEIDIGFLINSTKRSQLESLTIRKENMILAIPSKYNNIIQSESVNIKNFKDYNFIMPIQSGGRGYYNKVIDICMRENFFPRIKQEVSELHIIISLVASGMGIAIVPEKIKKFMNMDVVYRNLNNEYSNIDTELAYKKENHTQLIQNFIEVVQEVQEEN